MELRSVRLCSMGLHSMKSSSMELHSVNLCSMELHSVERRLNVNLNSRNTISSRKKMVKRGVMETKFRFSLGLCEMR